MTLSAQIPYAKVDASPASRSYGKIVVAIVLAGLACRAVQYIWNPSLWHDEALVALNVMDKTASELTGKLDYDQAAPPAFLWAERGLYLTLGPSEFSLRLVSFVCGMLALPLFAWLAWKLFPPSVSVGVVAIFAFCNKFIWHSAEVKPYSGDVLVAVVLLCITLWPGARPSKLARALLLSCVAALSIWFSFPSCLMFGGLSLTLLIGLWQEDGGLKAKPFLLWTLGGAFVLLSFALLYKFSIKPQHVQYLSDYWQEDFPNLRKPLHLPLWLMTHLYQLADQPQRSLGAIMLLLSFLGICGCLLTGATQVRGAAQVLAATTLPVVMCLLASCAKQYPFNGDRTTVFLLPGLILLSGCGLDLIRELGPEPFRKVWVVLALALVIRGVVEASYSLFVPRSRSGARPIAQFVRAHRAPDEAIYMLGEKDKDVVSGHCLELLCYWHNPPGAVHAKMPAPTEIPEKRFWIVFTSLPKHGIRNIKPLLAELATFARQERSKVVPGGAAYLFERSAASPPPQTQPQTQPLANN